MRENHWRNGMLGLIVGDALGVPVQFKTREEIKNRKRGPVTGMESGGVFDTPEGTWSDDSSMALATLDSIREQGKVDLEDIMNRFVLWEYKGEYTPFGEAFDEGNTCYSAIYKYTTSHDVTTCGLTGERANGNGALMRILPVCIQAYFSGLSDEEAIKQIHQVSALTHNHIRGQMCCGLYYFCVKNIIEYWEEDIALKDFLRQSIEETRAFYETWEDAGAELSKLERLFDLEQFKLVPEQAIKSSGYVVDSLEAAIWCLITTGSLKDCLLKAVNLGDDADTVAAIAGGLAGLYYGAEAIPNEWMAVLKRKEWIEELFDQINK